MGRGRWAFALTLAGFAWALALVAAAFVVPVYSGESVSAQSTGTSGGTTVETTHRFVSTLVHENGLRVLIPLAIPVALAALVWFALHRRCSRGSRWGGPVAWIVVAVLALFSLVTGFTIGLFVFPVAVLLGTSAAVTPLAPADAQ